MKKEWDPRCLGIDGQRLLELGSIGPGTWLSSITTKALTLKPSSTSTKFGRRTKTKKVFDMYYESLLALDDFDAAEKLVKSRMRNRNTRQQLT